MPRQSYPRTTDLDFAQKVLNRYAYRPGEEPQAPPQLLKWSPPTLTNPTEVNITAPNPGGGDYYTINLNAGEDAIINMPSQAIIKGLAINGGRHVHLFGGEIDIPDQGASPSINSRRAFYVTNNTGIVHIEGLYAHGDDISEGIQYNSPNGILQLQNCRFMNLHARDQVDFTDNHPDLIQPWGGMDECRVDMFTGETDYQGIQFGGGALTTGASLTRINMRAMPTARYMLWDWDGDYLAGNIDVDQLYMTLGDGRTMDTSCYPNHAGWGNEPIEGLPPGGDFVPAGVAGIGYNSPGYQ